jgi:hypothetical protein
MTNRTFLAMVALAIVASPASVFAQAQGQTSTTAGSKSTFKYSVESTYGVTTSANSNPNFIVDNEAVLLLKQGSFVTNKFGDDSGNAKAVFVATPTGGGVDLQGITGKNLLLIDDGTMFRSSLRSVDPKDYNPEYGGVASGSALATHTSTVLVERVESTFSQSFATSF